MGANGWMRGGAHPMQSLQEKYAPASICFGCGPANAKGLRIRSMLAPDGDGLVCEWTPEPHHHAFENMLNGGICSAVLDCHSNWAAAVYLMKLRSLDALPGTVTSELAGKLRPPPPMGGPPAPPANALAT